MEKFEAFRPDEETIESWLDAFEARLLCHNIVNNDKKRHWCQALVGEAGRSIIKKLPGGTTWAGVKQELNEVLGEANPKDRAFDKLLSYKSSGKGLGEVATDIITIAARATDDVDAQNRLGLRAFLSAIPMSIGRELKRKHLTTVKEALEEARFLQRVEEEDSASKEKVLTVEKPQARSQKELVEECIRELKAQGLLQASVERPPTREYKCWSCGEQGHTLRQCPVIARNRAAQAGPSRRQGNE